MQGVINSAFEHSHELLNGGVLDVAYEFLEVGVDILVHPGLVPDEGVILIELALDQHADHLLSVGQRSLPVILLQELANVLPHKVNCVVQV